MSQSRVLDPVMHTSKTDFLGIDLLSTRLLKTGIYKNTTEFATPKIALLVFEPAAALLHDLIGQASKNKSFVNQRNSQALLVHGYLEKNLLYAKDICNHDGDMIDLSGFDRNYLPENAKTPEKPVIKKVGKGKEVDTYKVILVKKQIKPMEGVDPVTHQKGVKFTIELSVTPEEVESWKEIGRDLASTKLVFKEVITGKKNFVRVYGVNTKGRGEASEPSGFTPEF